MLHEYDALRAEIRALFPLYFAMIPAVSGSVAAGLVGASHYAEMLFILPAILIALAFVLVEFDYQFLSTGAHLAVLERRINGLLPHADVAVLSWESAAARTVWGERFSRLGLSGGQWAVLLGGTPLLVLFFVLTGQSISSHHLAHWVEGLCIASYVFIHVVAWGWLIWRFWFGNRSRGKRLEKKLEKGLLSGSG